jgi:hypothetical protein
VAFWLQARVVRFGVCQFFLLCLARLTLQTADFCLRQFSFSSAQINKGCSLSFIVDQMLGKCFLALPYDIG